MFNCPEELRYARTHEWVREEDGLCVIGLTDFAQDALGDGGHDDHRGGSTGDGFRVHRGAGIRRHKGEALQDTETCIYPKSGSKLFQGGMK